LPEDRFTYRVTDGWLRDLASRPTPDDPWPCIRWDERLLADQLRFLDAQAELGVEYNLVWGLFVDRSWPVPFNNVIDDARERMLDAFVNAAHQRSLKVLSGVGIYSWGFEEVIAKVPGVSAGHHQAMCAFSQEAWDWQRRVLDFLMDPRWRLDGISMQSADQGRCQCERCSKLSPADHHANLLIRCAAYVRAQRPNWVIGQASWGLRLDEPGDFPHLHRISRAVDYMVEVQELSASGGSAAANLHARALRTERAPSAGGGRRPEIAGALACAFGSVGGVFVEPPQHWDRSRWFLPCGLRSAQALARLWQDGGRACEYFYRPFANPGEEVSWRTGARILSSPLTSPETALAEAVSAVYGVEGSARASLADWYARAEAAYFSRARFAVGDGSLSLEPLIWKDDPAAPGPPVYLRDRMSAAARAACAQDLTQLKAELLAMSVPNADAVASTAACIEGTLKDIRSLE
jgi:hypothetical protein